MIYGFVHTPSLGCPDGDDTELPLLRTGGDGEIPDFRFQFEFRRAVTKRTSHRGWRAGVPTEKVTLRIF